MFSLRYLAIFAIVAAASSLPAQEKPIPQPITTITNDDLTPPMPGAWFNVPFFGDITKLFAPLWKLFPSFEDLGPRILADNEKFQVIIQVQDFKKTDLKVKAKKDFIFVQGSHEAKEQDHDLFASQFFHTYTLPANASASDITAELTSDGYLIVTAPINGPVDDQSKETDREVPIVETGVPYKKDETPDTTETPELTTSAPSASEEDRKEPTTPSEKEDVTETFNVIPHGNENEISP